MQLTRLAILAAAVAMATTALGGDGPQPPAKTVVLLARKADGKDASEAEIRAAADVVNKRLAHAGYAGVAATADVERRSLALAFQAVAAGNAADACRLAARPGVVEFRVRVREADEKRYRAMTKTGGLIAPPTGMEWAPRAAGGDDMLLEKPERIAAAALAQVRARGLPETDSEVTSAREAYERALAENVFTGADVVRSALTRKMRTRGGAAALINCVEFEFAKPRRKAFEDFTRLSCGRDMAVLLDGKAVCTFLIRSALPGQGELSGSPAEFTDDSAAALDAAFASGPLAVELRPAEEAK